MGKTKGISKPHSQGIDILRLSDELSVRRYLFGKGDDGEGLELRDYVALVIIAREAEEALIYDGRTYLRDISHRMRLTTRQTSKLVGNLRDQGLVDWTHDGDGSEGTYVTITEQGRALLDRQRDRTAAYHKKVVERFGEDNLVELLGLMRQLETVLEAVSEEAGDDDEQA